jgi:hypothetical protein
MTNSTMTCAAFDEALPDYLEGTLDGSLRAAVEGHLRECVRCTGLVRDLRGIEAEAAKLPQLVPSRDLWQGIETRIAAPVIPLATRPERARRFAPWMGIAAAALVITTAGVTYTLTARSLRSSIQPGTLASAAPTIGAAVRSGPAVVTDTNAGDSSTPQSGVPDASRAVAQQSAPSTGTRAVTRNTDATQSASPLRMVNQSSPTEAVYSKEIDMLQRIVTDRKTQLDSSTVAIIEKNLEIIDRAIEQSKAALARDPASRLLSDQLTRALDKKVELLRRAAMLPVNT